MKRSIAPWLLSAALYLAAAQSVFAAPSGADRIFCERAEQASAYSQIGFRFLRPGKADWIFRDRTDFRPLRKLEPASAASLARFVHILRQNGTQLVIVVPPPRGIVGFEFLDRTAKGTEVYNAAAMEAFHQDLLSQLRSAGAIVPDLVAAGKTDLTRSGMKFSAYYYAMDGHWSPVGAASAAKATAAAIYKFSPLQLQPEMAFETKGIGHATGPALYHREISRLCGLSNAVPKLPHFQTSTIGNGGFLDDRVTADVTLVGTSFSNMGGVDLADFAGTLRKHLKSDVINRALPGGGADMAMNDFLLHARSPKWPRILVWEFPPHLLPDENALAQFEGAVSTQCPPSSRLVGRSTTVSIGVTSLLELPTPRRKRHGNTVPTLILETSASHLRQFDIILGFRDGTERKVPFDMAPATPAPKRFFLSIPWKPTLLERVSFVHRQPFAGAIQASLCQ